MTASEAGGSERNEWMEFVCPHRLISCSTFLHRLMDLRSANDLKTLFNFYKLLRVRNIFPDNDNNINKVVVIDCI